MFFIALLKQNEGADSSHRSEGRQEMQKAWSTGFSLLNSSS